MYTANGASEHWEHLRSVKCAVVCGWLTAREITDQGEPPILRSADSSRAAGKFVAARPPTQYPRRRSTLIPCCTNLIALRPHSLPYAAFTVALYCENITRTLCTLDFKSFCRLDNSYGSSTLNFGPESIENERIETFAVLQVVCLAPSTTNLARNCTNQNENLDVCPLKWEPLFLFLM